jgi:hypothetical protein
MGAKNLFGKLGKFALNVAGVAGVPGVGVLDKAFNLLEGKGMSPETKAELSRLREANKQELAVVQANADAKRIAEVNATIRMELKEGNWLQKGWRPLLGYSLAGYVINNFILLPWFPEFKPILMDTQTITMLGAATGLAVWSRGKEKLAKYMNGK